MKRRNCFNWVAAAAAGIIGLTAAESSRAADENVKAKEGTCVAVAKGGVGESGASTLLLHSIDKKTKVLMVIKTTETSLCGNTGAIAILVVNGRSVAHGAITRKGSSLQVVANPGDDVIALIHTIPLFNDIVCVRLGELEVEFQECEIAP